MAFEKYIIGDENITNLLDLHHFRALLNERAHDKLSKIEIISDIETILGVTLLTDEKSDLNNIMDSIDGGVSLWEKSVIADEVYRVCMISRYGSHYNNITDLKSRLNWI